MEMGFREGVRRIIQYQGNKPSSFKVIKNSGILGEHQATDYKIIEPEKARKYIQDEGILEKLRSRDVKANVIEKFERGSLRKNFIVMLSNISKAPNKRVKAFLNGRTNDFKKIKEMGVPNFIDLMKIRKYGEKSQLLIEFEKENRNELSQLEKVVNTLKEIDRKGKRRSKYIT